MATKLTPAQIIRNMQNRLESDIEELINKFTEESGVRVINIEGEEGGEENSLSIVTVLSIIDIQDDEDDEE